MRTKDLRPELLAKDGIKRHGLVFMGMAIKGDGEISSSGFQMYYSNENMIRKLVNSSSIEEVANQVIVLPPFFDNKDLGATRKGPSPFIIGGMFKRAQKVCGVSESIPLTADRFSCNKLLLEGWVLTVAPPLQ
jgi:hypothetical protein